jgi:hypothetical protein
LSPAISRYGQGAQDEENASHELSAMAVSISTSQHRIEFELQRKAPALGPRLQVTAFAGDKLWRRFRADYHG